MQPCFIVRISAGLLLSVALSFGSSLAGGQTPQPVTESASVLIVSSGTVAPEYVRMLRDYVDRIPEHPRPWRWVIVAGNQADWARFQDRLARMVNHPLPSTGPAHTVRQLGTTYIAVMVFAGMASAWEQIVRHEVAHASGVHSEQGADRKAERMNVLPRPRATT